MEKIGYIAYTHEGRFIDYDLFEVDYEMKMKCPMTEKEFEQDVRFFRIQSERMKIAGIAPLVKINCDTERIYFLAGASSRGETERVLFQSRGLKLSSLRHSA